MFCLWFGFFIHLIFLWKSEYIVSFIPNNLKKKKQKVSLYETAFLGCDYIQNIYENVGNLSRQNNLLSHFLNLMQL